MENIHQLDMYKASSKTEGFLFQKELALIIHFHEKYSYKQLSN
jgi:hypothetical protein